jgi:hypothetical protein
MSRLVAMLLLAAVTLGFTVPAASAASPPTKIDADLTALWTKVLETPSAQNSFGTGGAAFACWNLGGGTVSPFAPNSVSQCTVAPGTKILVIGYSAECSTFEGNGITEAQLRTCAEQNVAQIAPSAPSITVDGQSVSVMRVETRLMNIVLPADNIFGEPPGARIGLSVGAGWVAHLDPLTPVTHSIVIDGIPPGPVTTNIIVTPGS